MGFEPVWRSQAAIEMARFLAKILRGSYILDLHWAILWFHLGPAGSEKGSTRNKAGWSRSIFAKWAKAQHRTCQHQNQRLEWRFRSQQMLYDTVRQKICTYSFFPARINENSLSFLAWEYLGASLWGGSMAARDRFTPLAETVAPNNGFSSPGPDTAYCLSMARDLAATKTTIASKEKCVRARIVASWRRKIFSLRWEGEDYFERLSGPWAFPSKISILSYLSGISLLTGHHLWRTVPGPTVSSVKNPFH